MMRKIDAVRALLWSLAILSMSCAGTSPSRNLNLTPAAPAVLPAPPLGAESASQMVSAIQVENSYLTKTVNDLVPPSYTTDRPVNKDLMGSAVQFKSKVTVTANRGPLSLSFAGLQFAVAGTITGTAHVDGETSGVKVHIVDTVDFKIDTAISGSVGIGPDWKLVAKDISVKLTVQQADLPVGHYDFDVLGKHRSGYVLNLHEANLVQLAVNEFQDPIAAQIAKAIAAQDLRPRAAPLWAATVNPVKVYSQPETWLTFVPTSIGAAQTPSTDGNLHVSVAISGHTAVSVGVQPASVDPGALPDLTPVPAVTGFHVGLPVTVDLASISKVVAPILTAKPLKAGVGVLKVDEFSLYGNGSQIVAVIKFKASKTPGGLFNTTGTLYLVGTLAADPKTHTLALSQFDFDQATNNSILKFADWLAHGTLVAVAKGEVNKYLSNLGTNPLDEAKTKINKAIENLAVTPNVTLQGNLTDIDVARVSETTDAVVIDTRFTGTLGVLVH